MKVKGRQSNNVEIQTNKQREVAKAGYELQERQKTNPRTVNEGEPIAWSEKTNEDRALGTVRNPGRVKPGQKVGGTMSGAERRGLKDPAPQSLDTTSRSNYDEVPFLEHKCKDC